MIGLVGLCCKPQPLVIIIIITYALLAILEDAIKQHGENSFSFFLIGQNGLFSLLQQVYPCLLMVMNDFLILTNFIILRLLQLTMLESSSVCFKHELLFYPCMVSPLCIRILCILCRTFYGNYLRKKLLQHRKV